MFVGTAEVPLARELPVPDDNEASRLPRSATCAIWSSFAASSPPRPAGPSPIGHRGRSCRRGRRGRCSGGAALAAPTTEHARAAIAANTNPSTNASSGAWFRLRTLVTPHDPTRSGIRARGRFASHRRRDPVQHGRERLDREVAVGRKFVHDAVDDEAEPCVRCAGPQQHDGRVLLEVRSCGTSGTDHEPPSTRRPRPRRRALGVAADRDEKRAGRTRRSGLRARRARRSSSRRAAFMAPA